MGLFDYSMNIGKKLFGAVTEALATLKKWIYHKKLFGTAAEAFAALKKRIYPMMAKHNQHVVPHEGKWAVKVEGSDKPSSVHDTQEEAIQRGREVTHRLGTVLIIHDVHGRIEHQENIITSQAPEKKANTDHHVVPHKGKWAVKSTGRDKPISVHNTQHEAIEQAREFAKKQGTVLFIHGHDGHIREQHDYSQ
ncbi:MAG: DUF2188 domain-containing protein [Bdellovibrio sp.]